MNTDRMNNRITRVELLAIILVIVFSLAILIPVVNFSREAQRRATCITNVKHIGLAMANYASIFHATFPGSAQIIKASDGTQTVGGWSFLVRLLPLMEYDALSRTLSLNSDPEDTSNPAIVALMKTQLSVYVCPSSFRRSTQSQSAGITSYKASGASTRGSLAMVVNRLATPPYGPASLHPDGAIFPGIGTPIADIIDGTSRTIFTIETIDEAASRWTVGKEVTLVSLPQSSSPTGPTPQSPFNCFVPPGFDGTYGPDSAVAKTGLRTFLSYDFSPRGADAGKYEDPGFGTTPPAYGPSSGHPAVVICGRADGSVDAISKQVDAANLFFLITKNNNDPPPNP